MKRKISYEESRRILSRVPESVGFWLCTNEKLRNLEELARSLEKANDDVFRYHVNREKNDFENWIRDIIQDREFAREISRIKTRQTLIRKISERVDELKKVVRKRLSKAKHKKNAAKKRHPAHRKEVKRTRAKHTARRKPARRAVRKATAKRTSRKKPARQAAKRKRR